MTANSLCKPLPGPDPVSFIDIFALFTIIHGIYRYKPCPIIVGAYEQIRSYMLLSLIESKPGIIKASAILWLIDVYMVEDGRSLIAGHFEHVYRKHHMCNVDTIHIFRAIRMLNFLSGDTPRHAIEAPESSNPFCEFSSAGDCFSQYHWYRRLCFRMIPHIKGIFSGKMVYSNFRERIPTADILPFDNILRMYERPL